ncbi:MAG: hypothetical protein ABID04_02760, partial [Patescibacteria group bacterium]
DLGLGETQKRWLESELPECLLIPCLAIAHMPLGHPFSEHVMGEGSQAVAQEAKWLSQLLLVNGVKELFCGHLHFASSYYHDELKTNVVGAITRERNYQTSRFVELKIDGNDWQVSNVEVTESNKHP